MPKILLIEDNELNQDLLRRSKRTRDRAIVAIDGAAGVTKTLAAPSQIPKSSIKRYF